jgi:hypothetical protein
MARLILSLDGQVLAEYNMSKERYTVGRLPDNDVRIDNPTVSGHHSVLINILNDSFLEDLNSTNGTLVNGQPIKKHFLRNNDVIELGKYKMKYMADLQAGAAASDFEKNAAIRSGSLRLPSELQLEPTDRLTRSSVGVASQPKPPAPGMAAAVQLLNGPNAGKELDLTKTLTTLGKPGLQVAVIARRPHGYFITHVEGAQFPLLNGKSLDAQAHPLADHDVIEIAGIKMAFFLKG